MRLFITGCGHVMRPADRQKIRLDSPDLTTRNFLKSSVIIGGHHYNHPAAFYLDHHFWRPSSLVEQ